MPFNSVLLNFSTVVAEAVATDAEEEEGFVFLEGGAEAVAVSPSYSLSLSDARFLPAILYFVLFDVETSQGVIEYSREFAVRELQTTNRR